MSALVAYGSSDDEDDIQPEKPAKIAKTNPKDVPTGSDSMPKSPPARTQQIAQDSEATQTPSEDVEIPNDGPAPGPAAPGPTTVARPSADPDATPFSPFTYERQRLRELTMPTVPNFDIPDSPPPPPQNSEEAASLAARTKKFERFLELKRQGVHFNERLQNTSSLRNPSLLPKLMDFAGISQEESYASSLPDDLAVPVTWPEECYIENLLRQNERREKKRVAEREKVVFVPAAKTEHTAANGVSANGEARKSRFDQR